MSMYTELIFGAELKLDTPSNIIKALQYMLGYTKKKPNNFPFINDDYKWLFRSTSSYFGVDKALSKMWYDKSSHQWALSTRSNVKASKEDIDTFLKWIKQYIDSGSGLNDIYAIVIYEEAIIPDIYYLYED